jgi:putative nucleotidyltransferase with HDIG domain
MHARADTTRYLPHAVLATAFVTGLPAVAVWAFLPVGHPALLVLSVPLGIGVSVIAAAAGAAFWMRRPGSRDLVFADLMLWGWIRRLLAERRLSEARRVLGLEPGASGPDLPPDRRVEALRRLGERLEATDPETWGHTRRVTRHAERIARAMHLPPEQVAQVRTAAALHDVGKIHTPREILGKPAALTEAEYAVVQRHPVDGAAMVEAIEDPAITAMVRHHHERLDGCGYPDGLAGDAIPLGARIIAVADTFDAITSTRAYHGPRTHKRALDVLAAEAGERLDADAVAAFAGYYSGRRVAAWSALVAMVPQRVVSWMGSGPRGLGAQTLPAMGAAALIAGPLAAQSSPEEHGAQRAVAGPAPRATAAPAPGAATAPPRRAVGTRPAPAPGGHGRRARRARDTTAAAAPPQEHAAPPPDPTPAPSAGGPAAARTAPSASAPAPPPAEPVRIDAPGIDIPAVTVDVPAVTVDVPAVTADLPLPIVDVPPVELPGVELPDVDLPAVELPRVERP